MKEISRRDEAEDKGGGPGNRDLQEHLVWEWGQGQAQLRRGMA